MNIAPTPRATSTRGIRHLIFNRGASFTWLRTRVCGCGEIALIESVPFASANGLRGWHPAPMAPHIAVSLRLTADAFSPSLEALLPERRRRFNTYATGSV